jgi:hypothetical protein
MTDPRYTRGTASRNVVQPQWIIWVGVAFFLAGILVLVGWRQMRNDPTEALSLRIVVSHGISAHRRVPPAPAENPAGRQGQAGLRADPKVGECSDSNWNDRVS